MRTHRFYTDILLTEKTSVELPSEAAHHCAQVLRYKVGNKLTVFNGNGFDYLAEINSISKKKCFINILDKIKVETESNLKIHLLQSIVRGDKMDFIIQKSVELGVNEITPVFTERSNVKINQKRQEKKKSHWENTIISACEQSGRATIPLLNDPISINDLESSEISAIFLEPKSERSFTDISKTSEVKMFIGPEGGLSEKDIQILTRKNFIAVKMGPRILRTETASLSAISIIQNVFGDL